jgi:hypothetical protein
VKGFSVTQTGDPFHAQAWLVGALCGRGRHQFSLAQWVRNLEALTPLKDMLLRQYSASDFSDQNRSSRIVLRASGAAHAPMT